tara:strand:- start:2753 stop:3385 length:633 start_codon:yes stop_codon:yes gene_type:complete
MEHIDIFPTSIFHTKVKGYGILNQKIEKYIYNLKKEHPEEPLISCVNGWNSPKFNFKDKIPKYIVNTFQPYIKSAMDKLRYDYENFNIGWDGMWAVVNNQYAYNLTHTHGDSVMSMAYYVKIPKGDNIGGEIFFKDPRSLAMNASKPVEPNGDIDETLYHNFSYSFYNKVVSPKEGELLLFPGWLEHGVHQSTVEGDRIVISANINLYEK